MCAKALALTSLDAFLTRAPGAYQVHELQAEYYLALGNEERALAKYHEALVAKPDTIRIHQNVGNIFMKLGLPPSDADHRRVLAVLRYLES